MSISRANAQCSSPQVQASPDDLLPSFLKINNDLRRMNNETILLREQRYASQLGAAPVAGEADLF